MLRNASVINGYAIAASDGHLGTVSDFLFDDVSWLIRWLVVDTGNWLSGRKVLLPAFALGPTGKVVPGNTGIVIGYDIKHAVDLIRSANVKGPEVK